jgi:hypothetical protein
MPQQKELNRSNAVPDNKTAEMTDMLLRDRLRELEMKNTSLQGLIVELLDKNERLRSTLAQMEKKN